MRTSLSRSALALAILTVAVLGSSSSYQSVNNKGQDGTREVKSKPKPIKVVEFGPLKLETYFDETRMEDKLRLSKKHTKFILRWGENENQAFTFKRNLREDLMRCENLTLLNPDQQSVIDCRPIAMHVIDDSYQSTGDQPKAGNYVRVGSIRSKSQAYKMEIRVFPLLPEIVPENIDTILESQGMSKLEFDAPSYTAGYYFEARRILMDGKGISCTGNVYLSVNTTKSWSTASRNVFPSLSDDYLEFSSEIKNGYFFSLKDFGCKHDNLMGFHFDFSTVNDLTILRRQKFPYLTVHHRFYTSPLDSILDYTGIVKQQRDPDSNSPSSYNTTIDIKCSSTIFRTLNFQLDQIFVNEDLDRGFEKMVLKAQDLLTEVEAVWDTKHFLKNVRFLYNYGEESEAKFEENLVIEARVDDEVSLNFRFKKRFVDEWRNKLSGFFGENLKINMFENNNIESGPRQEL